MERDILSTQSGKPLTVLLKNITCDSLFDGADTETLATIDQEASVERFEARLEALILEVYPNAAVAWEPGAYANIFVDPGEDTGYPYTAQDEARAVEENIQGLVEFLYGDFQAWMCDVDA